MTGMASSGYNNRWIRLAKDLLLAGLGLWLIYRGSFFSVLLGIFAISWYGRDAYYQAKVLWQEKHFEPRETASRPEAPSSAPSNSDKITVTNGAKEVEFEKE